MTRPATFLAAIAVAMVAIAGCGGGSSSDDSSPDRASGAAAIGRMTGVVDPGPIDPAPIPQQAKPHHSTDQAGGKKKNPNPLAADAGSARARRALSKLLHPKKSARDERGGVGGVLGQILRNARKQFQAPSGEDDDSGDDEGVNILEMLR